MRQVMHNLINNSIKFTKANDNPHIIITSKIATTSDLILENPELKTKKMLLKKKYCHITFSDNGIGFKPQYKELIFEVFQRLNGKEDYAGTGIGLSIVKKIIQNHNGFILASSELDKGATFDIYIPEM